MRLPILPIPASINRQQALLYAPRVELERGEKEGRLHVERRGKSVWYRTQEVIALNASFTAKSAGEPRYPAPQKELKGRTA